MRFSIKKPFKLGRLEGLHPVYLALIFLLPYSVPTQNDGSKPRQVFWLPRPSSDLPIPIIQNSGIVLPEEFPFHC
jgi:hypothetical protein